MLSNFTYSNTKLRDELISDDIPNQQVAIFLHSVSVTFFAD